MPEPIALLLIIVAFFAGRWEGVWKERREAEERRYLDRG